jgi:hypothetical protein
MTPYETLAKKIDCAIRPIEAWPGAFTARREDSRFRAEWTATVKHLTRELDAIGARGRVVQIAVTPGMFRQDGFPRVDTRLHDHPGVILSFTKDKRSLSFPCDTYNDWKDNIRAIALALEALRAVDRYGVTRNEEQYAGWTAIPAAIKPGFANADEAARWVASIANFTGAAVADAAMFHDPAFWRETYKTLAAKLHPDTGGSADHFKLLQEARRLVEQYHGGVK